MSKTAVKTEAGVASAATNGNGNGHLPASIGELIDIKNLEPSTTNPRKRFPEGPLAELAESIKTKGVIEPLIVRSWAARPVATKSGTDYERTFEIVCGERRYRAAKIADLGALPCIIRTLTDEEVLDIQIHENLHREDVHPMDEAFGYKFLQDKLACNITELALRVGKTESYVLNRLKLNQLIKEAQDDIDAGHLPLVYALEIAKYAPDAQKEILPAAYVSRQEYKNGRYVNVQEKGRMEPFKAWTAWINKNILFGLAKAPFSLKATNLRDDGLACVNCPERTGANVGLFDSKLVGKKDACLNPSCFKSKAERLIQVTRQEIADGYRVPVEKIPLLRDDRYSGNEEYFLGRSQFKRIGEKGSAKSCKYVVKAVSIADDSFGKVWEVCIESSGCKTHGFGKPDPVKAKPGATTTAGLDARAKLEFHKRKEELWDVKVGNIVRNRIFKAAAEIFAAEGEIGADIDHLLPELLDKLWSTSNSGDDSKTKNEVVRTILDEWQKDKAEESDSLDYVITGRGSVKLFARWPAELQRRVLFLFAHGNKGGMYWGRYKSQSAVQELAKEYNLNYQLTDAEVRFQISTKKSKPIHQQYLTAVNNGDSDKAKIPRQWTTAWKTEKYQDED